jgi:hypothetical protein
VPADARAAGDGGADGDCPWGGVRGPGRHRLFLQGHGGEPDAQGIYPMLHQWQPDGGDAELCDDSIFVDDSNGDGIWEPGEEPNPLGPDDLVHGEHFLVGAGAYVEFATTLCEDIDGDVAFYVANSDVAGSQSMHQLFVDHAGERTLIAQATDEEPGNSGYNPFIRVMTGTDPDVVPGDRLLMRTTNLNGYQFSVMVWQPPSEYESWILVHVP